MQVYDARRAIHALRSLETAKEASWTLQGPRDMAVVATYASLFEPNIASLKLMSPPTSHDAGPDLLNVRRFLDFPIAVAMAADRAELRLHTHEPSAWEHLRSLTGPLGWKDTRVTIRTESSK